MEGCYFWFAPVKSNNSLNISLFQEHSQNQVKEKSLSNSVKHSVLDAWEPLMILWAPRSPSSPVLPSIAWAVLLVHSCRCSWWSPHGTDSSIILGSLLQLGYFLLQSPQSIKPQLLSMIPSILAGLYFPLVSSGPVQPGRFLHIIKISYPHSVQMWPHLDHSFQALTLTKHFPKILPQ